MMRIGSIYKQLENTLGRIVMSITKKSIALILTAAIGFGSASALYAEDLGDEERISTLEEKVEELEDRISKLEQLILEQDDKLILEPGTYIGGDDIPVGEYSFAVSGTGQGYFYQYESYAAFLENDYLLAYPMIDEKTKEDLLKQGVKAVSSLYLTELNSVKVEKGNCIQVEGMTVEGIQN